DPTADNVGSTYVAQPSTATEQRGTTTEPHAALQEEPAPPLLPSASKIEKFLLTAADQESRSRDERLNRVIRSKYEAGLLKPYDYIKGYARLSRWMDRNVSRQSKQQILQPLSVLRPKFRVSRATETSVDLVFIEEAFERLLLDYDRVFSATGVLTCLWRRTSEIYKGNREFTELVGVDGYMMCDMSPTIFVNHSYQMIGRAASIYKLMAEESAVSYWEKCGHVAFDSTQKVVLTSCVLGYKPLINTSLDWKKLDGEDAPSEEGFVNCCFRSRSGGISVEFRV
ncbi:hypothetical protein J3R83DRAFT_10873, partial [Lanmaoa asiatica]